MVHVMRETHPTVIGDEVTIGHSRGRARLHDRGPLPHRDGRHPAERCRIGTRIDRRRRHARARGHEDSAALAGDGRPRQGAARADRRGSRARSSCATPTNYVALPARLHAGPRADRPHQRPDRLLDDCNRTKPARGMRDFLPDDVRRREYVIGVITTCLRALRLRAARDAGRREHRDAARQVRRGGQPAHLQDPEARRARGQRARPTSRCATT